MALWLHPALSIGNTHSRAPSRPPYSKRVASAPPSRWPGLWLATNRKPDTRWDRCSWGRYTAALDLNQTNKHTHCYVDCVWVCNHSRTILSVAPWTTKLFIYISFDTPKTKTKHHSILEKTQDADEYLPWSVTFQSHPCSPFTHTRTRYIYFRTCPRLDHFVSSIYIYIYLSTKTCLICVSCEFTNRSIRTSELCKQLCLFPFCLCCFSCVLENLLPYYLCSSFQCGCVTDHFRSIMCSLHLLQPIIKNIAAAIDTLM